MAYWIFKCNPKMYSLDSRLNDLNPEISWAVTRFRDKIAVGDIAFIWETGKNRGIRAVMRIDKAPSVSPELPTEEEYAIEAETDDEYRVFGTLLNRSVRLSHAEIRPVIPALSVFHGYQQATNFPVKPDEGEELLRLIEGKRI